MWAQSKTIATSTTRRNQLNVQPAKHKALGMMPVVLPIQFSSAARHTNIMGALNYDFTSKILFR